MRARSTPTRFPAARRLIAKLATAATASTLVATGVVAVPARSDLRAEIEDKIQTLTTGRAEPGWLRTADTGHPTELVGFEWNGAEPGAVEVRAKGPDGWGDWQRVEGDPAEGPDVDSPEHHDQTTAGPVWVGRDVDQVQVRVAEGSLVGLKLHALRSDDPPAAGDGGRLGGVKPAGAAPIQPGIVSRASWGADESFRNLNPGCSQPFYANSVRFSVVHHTAGTNNYTASDSAAIVRAIYYFHTHTNKWCDIGYNFLVDRFGTVFEGRAGGITKAVVGAHAEGFNTGSTGVAILGTFSTEPVPSAAYAAVRTLLAWKLALHGVDPYGTVMASGIPVRTITGHRDLSSTECPGDMGEARLPQLRADVAASMGVAYGSSYHPLSPARLLDTRNGTGVAAGRIAPEGTINLNVTDAGGVPASGVTAVALNMTVTNASGPASYLTVWPKGESRPFASNLNFSAGVSVPNLVIASVGADGSVSIYNNRGTVDVVADVQGWYSNVAGSGSSYVPVNPARVLDTRAGPGTAAPVGPGGVVQLHVAGTGGVPTTGVTAVVLNMTVDRATGPESYLTVWPSGATMPTASNLNFSAGPASTNLVIAQVGADGNVAIYNNVGSTDVIADVEGWFGATATPPPGSTFFGISPTRILDTRDGTGTGTVGRLGAGATIDLAVAGVGGVPVSGATSVVLNVTAVDAVGAESYLTLFPAGTARPVASNLNFVAGETVPNLVIVRVVNGKVSIYNNTGSTHVVADVQGWFSAAP
ncbi:MAG: N-acetylmuramoyl-L-alanine amidase [Actinomycetota bacterium]|nr:N-acetylmuramoyl-L-alanine amidase [Actinomycetota bacterium]